jgi:hypothetical protein
MILKSVRLQNVKCIENSECLDISEVTCLVGRGTIMRLRSQYGDTVPRPFE